MNRGLVSGDCKPTFRFFVYYEDIFILKEFPSSPLPLFALLLRGMGGVNEVWPSAGAWSCSELKSERLRP